MWWKLVWQKNGFILLKIVFHACFKYIFTILRITKFQRHNFGNEFLNTNSMRVRNNHWDFLPGVTYLQIDDYNFSSMEFSWQLNCVNFFCYDYQKHLCFKVVHQEFNCVNQTVIVKNDFFSLHLLWLLNTWLILKSKCGRIFYWTFYV